MWLRQKSPGAVPGGRPPLRATHAACRPSSPSTHRAPAKARCSTHTDQALTVMAKPPAATSSLRAFFIAQRRHASRLRQPPAAATGGASARLAALGAQGPLVLVEALLPALVHLLLGLAFRVAGGIRPEPPRCGERKRHQHPPPGHCSERSDLEILQCQ